MRIDDVAKIAKHYGLECQLNQTVEECAELTQAISKYNRATHEGWCKDYDVGTAIVRIIEEIAHVELMLDQLKYLLICEGDVDFVYDAAVKRQLERMGR